MTKTEESRIFGPNKEASREGHISQCKVEGHCSHCAAAYLIGEKQGGENGADDILGKLEALETILGLQNGGAWPVEERLSVIAATVIKVRTELEESQREVAKWKPPVMDALRALERVYRIALADHRGES